MVSLEALRAKREKEGEALKKLQGKLSEKREKKKLKEDIRKIKSAKLRSYTGMEAGDLDKVEAAMGKAFKGGAKAVSFGAKMLGKGLLGAGQAANEYYGAAPKPKKRKRRLI